MLIVKNIITALAQMMFLSVISLTASGQSDMRIVSIPDSISKNAYGVVRSSDIVFEYKSATSGSERHKVVITVLNIKGKDFSDFIYYGGRFTKLKSFSAKLYDGEGKELLKYKLSDVKVTEYSSSLASDAKTCYFECTPPVIPFTVVYEYEVAWEDGIFIFPVFFPQNDFNLSVEKASYSLITPEGVSIINKAFHMDGKAMESVDKGKRTYKWELKGLKAIKSEPLGGSLSKYVPVLYVNPQKFIYDGVEGEIPDWNAMGKWIFGLIEKRDTLSDKKNANIIELTKGAKNDLEKVRILYDYLGSTTRYVSIQLGIGGYQPMQAEEVSKTGFGDCKGLTNYMRAMLSAVGIPSNYTLIKLDSKDKELFKNFPNFYQMNHVILQVPLPNDTLWLECTNTKVPLGFVHNGISGHDALVVTKEGGKIYRLPDYPDSLNIDMNRVSVALQPDGSAKVTAINKCCVKAYDDYSGIIDQPVPEQNDAIREQINLPNVVIEKVKFTDDKSSYPQISTDYSWSTPLYGTKTGNRLFIPVNPYRETYDFFKTTVRTNDIKINQGYKDIDTIFINIPDGYEIETMPASVKIDTPFGRFTTELNKDEKGIRINYVLFMHSGEYGVDKYADILSFFEKISAAYKAKIVLRKKV